MAIFPCNAVVILMVVSHAESVSVVEIDATDLKVEDYDAIIDVRNLDEYEGRTSAANCTIGKFDPKGCLYGHVPGVLWMPQLNHCGSTDPSVKCTAEEQRIADVKILSGSRHVSHKAWAKALSSCTPLSLAFICHSGTRSLKAAKAYAELLSITYGDSAGLIEVVSVAGGTQGWYKAKRPTKFGGEPKGPKTCTEMAQTSFQLLMRHAATN